MSQFLTERPESPLSLDRDLAHSRAREAFEKWARWRAGARPGGGAMVGGGGGLLGRLTAGRGARVCPTCRGARRLPGHLVGARAEFLNVPCPGCDGQGRLAADLAAQKRTREIDCPFCARTVHGRTVSTGELPDGRSCHRCQGGKRLIVQLAVHPATIPGTRHLGPDPGPDPVVALVQRTVLAWAGRNETYWLARVVTEEYLHHGTQEMKALRLHVSTRWFRMNLLRAHEVMGTMLQTNRTGEIS